MSARKTCECPGCGELVLVTTDGKLLSHRRGSVIVQTIDGPRAAAMRRCEWGGKPAPTEPEREATP